MNPVHAYIVYMHQLYLHVVNVVLGTMWSDHIIPYSGKLSREKTFVNFMVLICVYP